MSKNKLTIDEQIEHMKNKGIMFNIVDEKSAKEFLTYNNYYFKIKSYAKNYEKQLCGKNKGKYINLEFAYLQDLSTIDMYLRKFIIRMSLDIEHYLKVQLLRDFMNNSEENGYNIVNDFLYENEYVKDNIIKKGKNSARTDLVNKYTGKFAIWNIVEVLSFGDFIKLYEIYYNKYPSKYSMANYLWSVKFLRNAAAHNNCLLNSLRKPYNIEFSINKEVNTFVSKIPGIKKTTRVNKLKNPVVHDFVVSLYVLNKIVTSNKIKYHTMKDIKELIDGRFVEHKEYYKCNNCITSYYKFVKIIVDFFYELSI